jgi:hypothetical protein
MGCLPESLSCVKSTRYFEEQVLRKRRYLRREWCLRALMEPAHVEAQPDGRVRYWVRVAETQRYLRVVTLADGETIHNAFFDRDFRDTNR